MTFHQPFSRKHVIRIFIVVLCFLFLKPAQSRINVEKFYLDYELKSNDAIEENASASFIEGFSSKEKLEERTESKNTGALFFVIFALLIGVATRHFFKKSPFPFTVILLVIGLVFGLLNRLGFFSTFQLLSYQLSLSRLGDSIDFAAHIDPHMLLLIFLPILIFEATYSMDLHTFKKTATNAILLAVPGVLLAVGLSAVLLMLISAIGIGLDNWTWTLALMFGAIISATDPVAVVSIIKELGAGKKLSTLIEGESLLNDGTAIVLFMLFFLGISGSASSNSPITEFIWVVFGGLLLGFAIGYLVIYWIKRAFNDTLVETSLVIAAAYFTYYLAEESLELSGVLALVALGLMIGGVGHARISPQVEQFMQKFWTLAGFIANCIIFLIVGIVIAERSVFNTQDFIVLLLLYFGIHLVRGIVIFLLYPIMRRSGYGLAQKEAVVVWFGGLRGAVGLALALIVMGVDDALIPQQIKDQFLFFTAGIVALTLLINASTIAYLIRYLGLDKINPAKSNILRNARTYLHQSSVNQLSRLGNDRYAKHAHWDLVKDYLPATPKTEKSENVTQEKAIAALRKRFLEAEKSSYYHQFRDGLLGAAAIRVLSDNVSRLLDENGKVPLSDRKDLEEQWTVSERISKMVKWPVIGNFIEDWYLDRVSLSYDCAVSFVLAQDDALKLLESMQRSEKEDENILGMIEEEINANRIEGHTFLRNLRINYPKVYRAVSTTQAIRALLKYEVRTIERLEKRGRVDAKEASRMMSTIDERMKLLQKDPPSIDKISKTHEEKTDHD